MTSWQEEYIEALKNRDKYEKLDLELVDVYTRLADRTAALEAEKAATTASRVPSLVSKDSASSSPTADITLQLKSDLAEALRAKGQLHSRLKVAEEELNKLRIKSRTDTKTIKDLSAERAALIIKVNDRDEELKGKAKLLEDVQDEIIALNLQLNVAEQRSEKLKGDNKELLDRWMAHKRQEADAMNNASNFS